MSAWDIPTGRSVLKYGSVVGNIRMVCRPQTNDIHATAYSNVNILKVYMIDTRLNVAHKIIKFSRSTSIIFGIMQARLL